MRTKLAVSTSPTKQGSHRFMPSKGKKVNLLHNGIPLVVPLFLQTENFPLSQWLAKEKHNFVQFNFLLTPFISWCTLILPVFLVVLVHFLAASACYTKCGLCLGVCMFFFHISGCFTDSFSSFHKVSHHFLVVEFFLQKYPLWTPGFGRQRKASELCCGFLFCFGEWLISRLERTQFKQICSIRIHTVRTKYQLKLSGHHCQNSKTCFHFWISAINAESDSLFKDGRKRACSPNITRRSNNATDILRQTMPYDSELQAQYRSLNSVLFISPCAPRLPLLDAPEILELHLKLKAQTKLRCQKSTPGYNEDQRFEPHTARKHATGSSHHRFNHKALTRSKQRVPPQRTFMKTNRFVHNKRQSWPAGPGPEHALKFTSRTVKWKFELNLARLVRVQRQFNWTVFQSCVFICYSMES